MWALRQVQLMQGCCCCTADRGQLDGKSRQRCFSGGRHAGMPWQCLCIALPTCPTTLLTHAPVQFCLMGYKLNEATQLCELVTCKVDGCLVCDDDPDRCDGELGCGAGNFYDEANNTCAPCSEGCTSCSKWGCGRCGDGYWMDEAARKCNRVRL